MLLLAVLAPCRTARADEPLSQRAVAPAKRPKPPVVIAVIAGLATALIPLGLGSMHTAGATSDADRDSGFMVAGAGLALAPIVSHLILGEWRRAAAFGAVPVASEILLVTQLSTRPDSAFHGTSLSRSAFGALVTFDLFGAAVGIYDAMLAGERAERDAATLSGFRLIPTFGPTRLGLSLSGTL